METLIFGKDRASNDFVSELTIPVILSLFQFALQTVFRGSYGYFRDELYYIVCSKHLAFGYVDQLRLTSLPYDAHILFDKSGLKLGWALQVELGQRLT
jgi:hypothetical protein